MEIPYKKGIEAKKFEKIVSKLNPKCFHVYRNIRWIDNKFYITKWGIYDKRVPWNEYWSNDYKPILKSENNTIEDLKRFVKENANATVNTQLGGTW